MDSGLCPEAEVCVHLSLSLPPVLFPLSTAPVQFPNSHLQELSACVGNGRAESEAALSQECEGRENYLLLPWGSAATLEPWEVKRGLQKHATLVFFFIYIYIYIYFPV